MLMLLFNIVKTSRGDLRSTVRCLLHPRLTDLCNCATGTPRCRSICMNIEGELCWEAVLGKPLFHHAYACEWEIKLLTPLVFAIFLFCFVFVSFFFFYRPPPWISTFCEASWMQQFLFQNFISNRSEDMKFWTGWFACGWIPNFCAGRVEKPRIFGPYDKG